MTTHDALLQRLVRVGKVAGQDALARLAYQMARRCLSAAPANATRHIRWFEDPRSVAVLYSDLLLLEDRTGLTLKKDELPLADPTSESAIQCARACIDLGTRIEGESSRLQYLRIQCTRAEGGLDEAADRLEVLLKGRLTKSAYQVIQESRQTVLLKLGRFDQVVEIGDTLLRYDTKLPVAAFNRLTAQAWMELESDFRESAARFRTALEGALDSRYLSQVVADEASWLAVRFGLNPSEVVKNLSLIDASSSSQRPDQ